MSTRTPLQLDRQATDNTIGQIVARNIHRYRKLHDLTQEQLAAELSVRRTDVNRWERARRRPSDQHLIELAAALGVPVADLFREQPSPDA